MLTILFSLVPAWGFSVEGPSYADKAEANTYAKTAKAEDLKGRVVRRFQDGKGWEYLVRFEAETEAEARAMAATLSRVTQAPVQLFDDAGKKLQAVQPSEAPAAGGEGSPEEDWMETIIDRHGPGRTVFSEAERVKLVFTRTLADGRVAKHTYARRGTDLYLKIEKVKGEVEESETIALGDAAWLVAKGETSVQDLQKARETIERFGPTSVVPMVLDLEELRVEHPELEKLDRKGTANVEGETCEVYASKGESLLAVGEDGLIRRVAVGGEQRVLEFRHYQEVAEVPVPREVRILVDGELKNTVTIEKIELDGKLDDAWFAPRG